MRFGSVCSGIEAASVAWNPLGWKAAWLSEIEPFPSAVLAHHYPDVPNLGDMTTLPARIRSGEVEAPDVFCGGTPCQAFSVAGLRKSLEDARGNLSLTFCEIADAIDESRSVRGLGAAIVFWENVPGVLSTADNAFGCFLAQLCGGDEPLVAPDGWPDAGCVSGPSRTAAWRVLDAQYFGLAQRRRRVFVVASARNDFDPAAVLFEFDGVRRDTAPSRETGKEVARRAGAGAAFGGMSPVAGILTANTGGMTRPAGNANELDFCVPTYAIQGSMIGRADEAGPQGDGINEEVCFTQNTIDRHAVAQPIGIFQESEFGVQHYDSAGTLRAGRIPEHQMVMQSVVGPLACNTGPNGHDAGNFACNQAVDAGHVLPIAFHPTQDPISSTEVCQSIGANDNATAAVAIGWDGGVITMAHGQGGAEIGFDRGPTLTCNHEAPIAAYAKPIAFPANLSATQHASAEDLAPAMGAINPTAVAVALRGREGGATAELGDEVQNCLRASSGGGDKPHVLTHMAVRRLTPVECERLQGFSDGYSMIPWKNKPAEECPDGPRYKALGNSWAVPVVRWIGKRIQEAA